MSAARSAASAAVADPAQAVRAARKLLRRWANAASTTPKTCSRVAVPSGGGRLLNETNPESTFGAGQKTLRPMRPSLATAAYQAALTLGTPYTRLPGGA